MTIPPLRFAFRVRLDFMPDRIRFPVRGGEDRGFTAIAGGAASGPMLEGEVVPGSGGDWPLFRSDGTIAFDARYLIRALDGTLIQVFNRGFAHAAPEIQQKIAAGQSIDPGENYFRLAPQFDTATGPHDWLTRSVLVGYGEKHPTQSLFDFYLVA